jgi:hypothetical protein
MMQYQVGGSPANPFGAINVIGAAPGTGPQGPGQIAGGFMADLQNLIDANQFNYAQTSGAQNAYQGSVLANADAIRQSGAESEQKFASFADQARDMSLNLAEGLRQTAEDTITGYENLSAQQASSISAGLAAQNRTTKNQLAAGAKLGDPNAIAADAQFELDQSRMRADTMTKLAVDYNNTMAQLGQYRTSTYGQAAGIEMSGEQLATSLNAQGIAMSNAAIAMAAEYEAQGLGNYAQMVASNPYNPVSLVPTLLSFFQATETPGFDSFMGFDPEALGNLGIA